MGIDHQSDQSLRFGLIGSKMNIFNNLYKSPTSVGFFVCGMMAKFGYAKIFIINAVHWAGLAL